MTILVNRIDFGLAKIFIVLLVLVAILCFLIWLSMRPANLFCNNLSAFDKYEDVISKASVLGYKTYELKQDEDLVVKIPTQKSPFFRMACVVKFSNGTIITKEVIADD